MAGGTDPTDGPPGPAERRDQRRRPTPGSSGGGIGALASHKKSCMRATQKKTDRMTVCVLPCNDCIPRTTSPGLLRAFRACGTSDLLRTAGTAVSWAFESASAGTTLPFGTVRRRNRTGDWQYDVVFGRSTWTALGDFLRFLHRFNALESKPSMSCVVELL